MLQTDDAERAIFATQIKGRRAIIRQVKVDKRIPHPYRMFANVFSDQESKKFPPKRPWDHKIELKPGAPTMLISKTIKLSTMEQEELKKFVNEHLEQGTILSRTASATSSITSFKSKIPQVNPMIRLARDPEKQGARAKPSGDLVSHDQTSNRSPDSSRVLLRDKSQDSTRFGWARSLLINKWQTVGTVRNQRRHMILVIG
jgi:hypothetical protein